MAIYLLIIMLSLLVFHIYLRYRRAGRLLHAVPGPSSVPLLGNLLHVGFKTSRAELWELLQALVKDYYPFFKWWILTTRIFVILHPDDVKILLSEKENITKGFMYKYTEPALGTGLLSSTGEKYHSRRKLISPAFNPNNLKRLIEISNKQGKDLIGRLRDAGDETIQNPKVILPRITLNIVYEWCTGVDLRTFGKGSADYQHAIETITETVMYRVFRPYLTDWMLKFLNVGRKLEHAVQTTKSFVIEMVNDRRKYHESTGYKYIVTDGADVGDSLETDELKARQRSNCLMDLLLAAERDGLIDGNGIEEEIQTIIAAAFDTSATVLSFLLILLAENKVAQDLARTEALEMLQNNGNVCNLEQVKKLDYIDRCIKETMRLYPGIAFIARTLQKDLHIRDYILPAGTDAAILIYNIHRNPEFWPNPEQFDPDRFLPEQVKTRHPFAYIPFSTGIRNCIGQKYGILQIKALTAMILSNFELEPIGKSADIKFKMDFVLCPNHPVYVKFIKLQTNR